MFFYTAQDTAITLQNWNNTSNYSDSGRAIKKCLSTVKVDASSETLTRHTEDVPGYVLQYYQSMVATIAQYLACMRKISIEILPFDGRCGWYDAYE